MFPTKFFPKVFFPKNYFPRKGAIEGGQGIELKGTVTIKPALGGIVRVN